MASLAPWGAAAASAVLGAVAGLSLFGPGEILISAFLAGTMGALAFEDMRSMRIPDPWNLAAALGGLVAIAVERASGMDLLVALGHSVLAGVLCGGALFLLREAFFRLRGTDGLGFGDVKLAATGGIWLGWELFPFAVLVAAFGAILWVLAVMAVERQWPRQRKVPFGAFLAPAIWVCWLGARLS
jgi:prepilin signal peptidase PulO-like enzyme (type II secretory pathway)